MSLPNEDGIVEILCRDESNPTTTSIKFDVRSADFGIWVTALDDSEDPLCSVNIEYFNNQLRAVCWDVRGEALQDAPIENVMLCEDVATERVKSDDQRYKEAGGKD